MASGNPLLDAMKTMSPDQLRAALKEVSAVVKDADEALRQEYAVLGGDFLRHAVTHAVMVPSATSDWVGASVFGIPVTDEKGKRYTVSLRMTDVAAKARRVAGTEEQAKQDPARYFYKKPKKAGEPADQDESIVPEDADA